MERFFIFSIFLVLFSISIFSRGHIDSLTKDETVKLVGIIKVKGNEPHTNVVLETEDNTNYILVGSQVEILEKEYQMHLVSILAKDISPSEGKKPAEVEVISFEVIE